MKYKFWPSVIIILVLCGIVALLGYISVSRSKIISPIPQGYWPEKLLVVNKVEAIDRNPIDAYVDEAANLFGNGRNGYSELKKTLHCLLYYESRHGLANGRGDNGLAEGLLQFHQATWVRMRNQMIKAGLVSQLSNRNNNKDSIITTAWAIANGRGNEWGPIVRGNCN